MNHRENIPSEIKVRGVTTERTRRRSCSCDVLKSNVVPTKTSVTSDGNVLDVEEREDRLETRSREEGCS